MPAPKTYPQVSGIRLDPMTRCTHYNSALDIVAIKMRCCGRYYACKECHDAMAGHAIETWPRNEWNQPAILCGACMIELSIEQHLACENKCPSCNALFNPACRDHYHFYFDMNP